MLIRQQVADLPTDDRTAVLRTEWVNPDQIETATPYLTWDALIPVLWLEVTFPSGTIRYLHIGPTPLADLDTATETGIRALLHPEAADSRSGSAAADWRR